VSALLAAAGRAFLRAFIGSFVTLLLGVLAAPNLDQAYGVGVAALIASVAAGIRAIQEFVPQLSLSGWIPNVYASWADAFLRAFVGSLVVTLPGVLDAPDFSTGKALAVAAVIGALTTAVRVIQGLLTPTETPVTGAGVTPAGIPARREGWKWE
jgi:hypothetical protein